ncbi:MAG: VIT1/CCC1 family protein [Candidatus Caldarchaeum sp.]
MKADYKRFVDNEFKDFSVYQMLARVERNTSRRKTLERLAEVEKRHYKFWLIYVPGYKPNVSKTYLYFMVLARLLMGVTFVVKALENHEKHTIEKYMKLASSIEAGNSERQAIEKVINEEAEVERNLLNEIDEAVVRYLGFMMLGVADAIIELTGVQAGFLGVTSSTLAAGIAGLIVGIAASISMAAASYLQARQGVSERPAVSGLVTGSIYMLTVGALSLPYYLIKDMTTAFGASIISAILLTAYFTYFSSVIQEKRFSREFAVSIAVLFVVTLAAYLLGTGLSQMFGVSKVLPI